jgi:rhodanese-related sulfurtransferase
MNTFSELETYLQDLKAGKAVLIDVREPIEYQRFHVEKALLWPLSVIEKSSHEQLVEFFKPYQGKHLYLHCRSGTRVLYALEKIKAHFPHLFRIPQSPEQIQSFIEDHASKQR